MEGGRREREVGNGGNRGCGLEGRYIKGMFFRRAGRG